MAEAILKDTSKQQEIEPILGAGTYCLLSKRNLHGSAEESNITSPKSAVGDTPPKDKTIVEKGDTPTTRPVSHERIPQRTAESSEVESSSEDLVMEEARTDISS
jgi:hypothetical protein